MNEKEFLAKIGIINVGTIYKNLPPARLVEIALKNKEGVLASNGALTVQTRKYTGRSPLDRFIIDTPSIHNEIDWGQTNQPMNETDFQHVFYRLAAYLEERDLFIFDGFAGTDKDSQIPMRVINQFAWQNLFIHQMLLRPEVDELMDFEPEFTVICAPGFNAFKEADHTHSEAFVLLNLEKKMIIIGGTYYAGELKKSVFTAMNFFLPLKGICPMHCSANIGEDGKTALFFGLSGTGKTTLSADPERRLIGDDEHGWSDNGIFNFEGGCYAKCINLSQKHEPQIWDAIRFGSVLENVMLDKVTRSPDYDSDFMTENTRAAYPVDYIPNAVIPGIGGHPNTIIFLTADAFGIMPPVAKLTTEQAIYHFLSGYTSKLAGTERGITKPQATFSTGFGEPFLPRHPLVYANLLMERINRHNVQVYLVNTGWTGGAYGTGQRISLPVTRAIVKAAINGDLMKVDYKTDPIFGFEVPESCPGIPIEILNPRNTWHNKEAYDETSRSLAEKFISNFKKFKDIEPGIVKAGPII
ncbi:MAG: phosphoenolpyruvate carboxykinase (ATP) [Dethiosulfatibacter sp.]|nr:phosphoenolpyruvate carboxykinase (ATP) [Dethiosulfatibacter sp.]